MAIQFLPQNRIRCPTCHGCGAIGCDPVALGSSCQTCQIGEHFAQIPIELKRDGTLVCKDCGGSGFSDFARQYC